MYRAGRENNDLVSVPPPAGCRVRHLTRKLKLFAAMADTERGVDEDDAPAMSPKPLKIDLHTHVLPPDWPNLKEKYGYGGFIQLENRDEKGADMMSDGARVLFICFLLSFPQNWSLCRAFVSLSSRFLAVSSCRCFSLSLSVQCFIAFAFFSVSTCSSVFLCNRKILPSHQEQLLLV
jgi:hypothetical protein